MPQKRFPFGEGPRNRRSRNRPDSNRAGFGRGFQPAGSGGKAPSDLDLLFYLSQASEMLSQQSLDALTAADPIAAERTRFELNTTCPASISEAEMEYQQALTLRPDVPGLHLELGEVYAASSQWSKAEEQFLAERGCSR